LSNAGSKYDLEKNDGLFFFDSKLKFSDVLDGTSNTLFAAETLRGDGGVRAMDVKRQHVRLKKADLKGLDADSGVKDWKADKSIAADRRTRWTDGRFLQGTFTATRKVNDAKPDVDCDGAGGLSGMRAMQPGVNVGMADGSVRFISASISFETWKAACTRAGGEVLGSGL